MVELLAPAGELNSGFAAFQYGADAVYLGMGKFSARAEAVNFTPEELSFLTRYAHAHGKRVPVIYRAKGERLQEERIKQIKAFSNDTPAPLWISTGIYGETDADGRFYAALNGKHPDFMLPENAKVIVTDTFDTFIKGEFLPLQKIQQKELSKLNPFYNDDFLQTKLSDLPQSIHAFLEKQGETLSRNENQKVYEWDSLSFTTKIKQVWLF